VGVGVWEGTPPGSDSESEANRKHITHEPADSRHPHARRMRLVRRAADQRPHYGAV
jgi:hypothetical protein